MSRFVGSILLALVWATNCSAFESLYLTTSDRLENYGLGEGYTFIGPYFTSARMVRWISITKAAAADKSSADKPSDSDTTPAKPQQATINFAGWQAGTPNEIRYAVTCDFQSVLTQGDSIFVSNVEPSAVYGGQKTVTRVTKDSVFVEAANKPDQPSKLYPGATINSNCPAIKVQAKPDSPASFAVAFGVTMTPGSRGYLYVSRNAFFNDSINVSVDSNGMLSNAEGSSTQQITLILTELAQAAGAAAGGGGLIPGLGGAKAILKFNDISSPRKRCFDAISNLLKLGPYYEVFNEYLTHPPGFDDDMFLELNLSPVARGPSPARLDPTDFMIEERRGSRPLLKHSGLVVFYPSPARATLACVIRSGSQTTDRIFLGPPGTINLYTSSEFMDPQRDFLTNPQHTITANGGFFTGQKFSDQSSAKTIVDTVTAPLRALIPSVSVQQTTQVQSTPGKPDQTTTSTQTTSGPPKNQ